MAVTNDSLSLLAPQNRRMRLLVTAFIAFNLLSILANSTKILWPKNWLEQITRPYLEWTRLEQIWPLFTPEPRRYSIKYRAEIRYRNGNVDTWRRPYPPNWSFFDRHLSYNFQKWDLATETIEVPGLYQQDLAAYLQRLHWNDRNPPEVISLVRSRAPVPPPNQTGYVQHDPSELVWKDHLLWVYHVSEKRFE